MFRTAHRFCCIAAFRDRQADLLQRHARCLSATLHFGKTIENVANCLCRVARQIIGVSIVDVLEGQAIEHLLALGSRNRLQAGQDRTPILCYSEIVALAQANDHNACSANASDIRQHRAATKFPGYIATLNVALYGSVAGGIDVNGTCAQFAALVNSDDDAINCSA